MEQMLVRLKEQAVSGELDEKELSRAAGKVMEELREVLETTMVGDTKLLDGSLGGDRVSFDHVEEEFRVEVEKVKFGPDGDNAAFFADVALADGDRDTVVKKLDQALAGLNASKQQVREEASALRQKMGGYLHKSDVFLEAGLDHFDNQLLDRQYDSALFQIQNWPSESLGRQRPALIQELRASCWSDNYSTGLMMLMSDPPGYP